MKPLIALVSFIITLGAVFVLSHHQSPPNTSAQILQETERPTISNIPSPTVSKLHTSKYPTGSVVIPISPQFTANIAPTITPQTQATKEIQIISALPLVFHQKSSAEIRIKTAPQSNCSIKVILPSGSVSGAKGLEDITTTTNGDGIWKWNVSWNTKTGTGTINLKCTKDSDTISKSVAFIIEK